jgi:hypothetical protein
MDRGLDFYLGPTRHVPRYVHWDTESAVSKPEQDQFRNITNADRKLPQRRITVAPTAGIKIFNGPNGVQRPSARTLRH